MRSASCLPHLLGTLERIAWVQRHLYPPLAGAARGDARPADRRSVGAARRARGARVSGRPRLHAGPARRPSRADGRARPSLRRGGAARPTIPSGCTGRCARFARVRRRSIRSRPSSSRSAAGSSSRRRRGDAALVARLREAALRDDEPPGGRAPRAERARRPGRVLPLRPRGLGRPDAHAARRGAPRGQRARPRLPVELGARRRARARCCVLAPTSRDRTWSIMGGEDVDAERSRGWWSRWPRAIRSTARASS